MREEFPLYIYQRDAEGRLPWDRANRKPRSRRGPPTAGPVDAAAAEATATVAAQDATSTLGESDAALAQPEPEPETQPLPRGGSEVPQREITLHLPRPHGAQQQIIEESASSGVRFNVLCCGRRFGKALALDTEIPTVVGWTTMGEIQEGDRVFDERGEVCTVTAVTEVMRKRKCYRLRFSDGTEVVADAEHQWVTMDRAERRSGQGRRLPRDAKVRTTEEIAGTLTYGKRRDNNHSIVVASPLQLPERELPIPPYTLGAWLGDGAERSATVYSDDAEVIEAIAADGTPVYRTGRVFEYRLTDRQRLNPNDPMRANTVMARLRALNLIENKHVPLMYHRASEAQRRVLLQGLLDTDGTVGTNGQVEFTCMNQRLAQDVYDLACSLGMKPTQLQGRAMLNGKDCGTKYRVRWITEDATIVRLPRKAARIQQSTRAASHHRRYIVACEEVPSVPVRCIQVDSASSLYLITRSCIPTHNTVLGTDRLIEPAITGFPTAWFSPTYKMLTETWRELKRALQPVVLKTSEQEHRLELLGGGIVECWSLEMPDAARGRRYKRIVIDEAAQVRSLDDIWKKVLRATLTDYQGTAWFLSTPRGLNDFHTLFQQGQSAEWPEWRSWRMPTRLNPYISLSEIESARKDLGPLAFAQEYEADFTALGDVAFPEFQPSVIDNATGQPMPYHVIPTDYALIRGWRRIAGHDYGYASPSATLWLAIDPGGGAVAYREFSCRRLHVDEVAASVLYRQGDERPVIYGDPSLFRMHGSAFLTSEMIADLSRAGKDDLTVGRQYRDAGMEMQPANNARIPGKLRLHTLLSPRPSDGVPYLRFMDCCVDTIATLQSLQLDPDRPEDVRTGFPSSDPVWQRDEFYDCLRYALMGIPSRVTRTPEERRSGLLSREEGGRGGASRQYEWGGGAPTAGRRVESGGW